MDWSPQQSKALDDVGAWLRSGEALFRLWGYAGTGKTTLARHLASQSNGHVQFCAYTGKAALVMRRSGCDNARTIHSLIYRGKDKSRQRLKELEEELVRIIQRTSNLNPAPSDLHRLQVVRRYIEEERTRLRQPSFMLNEESDIGESSLIVVDEASMVDERMGKDLLSFDVPILVLGDPAQLPPVKGGGFFTGQDPNVFLTEIHRQAADNPIIAMATAVREGRGLEEGAYGDSRVISKCESVAADYIDADQILVGKNATRTAINTRFRKNIKQISSPFPVPGDALVCLKNDHEVGLLNGSLWTCTDAIVESEDRILLHVEPEDDQSEAVSCTAHAAPFLGKAVDFMERREAQEFDYGYALTVHKAQGSQWDNVTLMDEWTWSHRKEHLYTAITRASKKITIIR